MCNVTVVDFLQHNHMFVKLSVPCKLTNQTTLGFPSAFGSANVLASREICRRVFFKWSFCDLYEIRLLLVMYTGCRSMCFQQGFSSMEVFLLLLYLVKKNKR